MKRTSPSVSRGFTLVEMLAVITIIVLLAAMVLGSLAFVKDKQAREKCKIQIQLLCKSIEDYKLDNGSYPVANNSNALYKALYWDSNNDGKGPDQDKLQKIYCAELDPNRNLQKWIQGTGASATIIDPWFNEFIYRRGDDTNAWNPDFDLWSKGKDGKTSTSNRKAPENKDDIGNF